MVTCSYSTVFLLRVGWVQDHLKIKSGSKTIGGAIEIRWSLPEGVSWIIFLRIIIFVIMPQSIMDDTKGSGEKELVIMLW